MRDNFLRIALAFGLLGGGIGASAQKPHTQLPTSGKPAADKPVSQFQSAMSRPVPKPADGVEAPKSKPKSYFDGQNGRFIPVYQPEMLVNVDSRLDHLVKAPWFEGAVLDADVRNLPYYEVRVPVGKTEVAYVADAQLEQPEQVSATTFDQTAAAVADRGEWYPATPVQAGSIITIQGQDYQHIRIYPIQVNTRGGSYRKAASVTYRVEKRQDAKRKPTDMNARAGYVSESVLRDGNWYKIGITAEGIYQLDYSFFNGLGVDPSTIDPRTVRVLGNGGATLPQVAGTYPHDDLVENAIFAQGEGDGQMNAGDYFLFYSPGLGRWEDNGAVNRYIFFPNFYADTTFLFVTWGGANGKRVGYTPSAPSANFTPTYTTKYGHYEKDLYNSITSGRLWMGERFDLTTQQTFNLNLPNVLPGSNVKTSVRVGARSNGIGSNFVLKEGGTTFANFTINQTSPEYGTTDYFCSNSTFDIPAGQVADGQLNIELTYSKPTTSSVGFLDYIEFEYQQQLNIGLAPFYTFTATDNVGPGQVFGYQFTGATATHQIWDVTDPFNVYGISASVSGNSLSFNVAADSIKRFIAFNGTGFRRPVSSKLIANQNLHALSQADFIIVTHPSLQSEAERLAAYHRDQYGQSVHVVRVQDIYNEFSSGQQDPTAIRDFFKMFYDRGQGGALPTLKYALLFGDGTYDYKGIQTPAGSNLVPTYQSRRSQLPTASYCSDDYYGFLDDGEGLWGEQAYNRDSETIPLFLAEGDINHMDHGLDIAVGRLPAANGAEATDLVDKIIGYHEDADRFGPWRNRVLLVADHKDADQDIHVRQADGYTTQIEASSPCTNIDKVYMDNYVMENQASGDRFPEGKSALLKSLDEGSLLVNYTGHGGEVGWSNAQILDISDINKIANGNHLPAYITATCEFGRWDDPTRKSGAETLLQRRDGGSIAMFTTVRVVFSGPNHTLNTNYYNYVFDYDDMEQRWPTMGEVFMRTKNVSWANSVNNRNFSLLGDPAMQLAYPEHKSVVTKINGATVDSISDTLATLSLITVEGEARDQQDNLLPNFSGDLYVTVFDRSSKFTTRRYPYTFIWRKNRVFKGTAAIQNGRFSFQFVVPADISYEDQLPNLNGKISLYFNDAQVDGGGCNDDVYIGGNGTGSIVDDRAPELDLFMNDTKFADGGLVDPDPDLLVEVFDENGINTVGTGIGHELTAILDHDESNVYILNDYYEANRNSYQEGTIRYPFEDLEVGEHHLRVKVWDVANNSKEGEINFVVADDATMALGHVVNYPNPFTTNTTFIIEHNRNGSALMVMVKIYTPSGRLVKTLEDNTFAEGNLYSDLQWDGLDEYGDAIGRGVYVYEVILKDQTTGERISTYEKLVVLR